MRFPLVLVILIALIGSSPAAVLAQGATPVTGAVTAPLASSADADRPDLAAMALTAADLPDGYVNADERYFLSAQGVATFYASEAASAEEIADLGLVSMYDSFFFAEANLIYLYIAEFESPDAVEAGFEVFEDETRVPENVEVLVTQDLPGPDIGEAPSETTVGVSDYRAGGGPLVDTTSVAFRVDRFLVSVLLETEVVAGNDETAATPVDAVVPPELDPQREQLVNDLAATMVERIEAVDAGEEVSGVDPILPPLVLPTDQVWPLPGVAAEGYKDASVVLGSLGPATDFADAFQSGYGRTVAPGTGPGDLYPEPPFVTVGVSAFEGPDAPMGVLEVADEVPVPGPVPPPQTWDPVETAPIAETDGSSAYRTSFAPGGPVDSARVAFASGNYFVTVDVQGAGSEQAALDAAEDLASQQAACLAAGERCADLTVPAALEAGAATPQAATPVAQTGEGGEVTILGPEEEYAGASLGEWNARWFQWAFSFPEDVNPNLNPSGCGYGQAGPVFFLPANFGPPGPTVTCVVPEGVAIYLPLGGSNCSTVEPPPYFGRDEDELRTCAATAVETDHPIGDEVVRINGQEVPDLATYRSSSPLTPIVFAEDNIFGVPAGVAQFVNDAYGFIIAPPDPGTYEIEVAFGPDVAVTYQVSVEAPQIIEPEATPEGTPEEATPVT